MVTPGEKVVQAQQSELQSARAKTLELRKQLERTSKELAVCKQQLQASQGALHNAELAVHTQQEYSRKLEQQLDRSGKGVALLKAAKLQSELEFLQKENSSLFKDLQAKNQEVSSLHKEVQLQKQLVEQAAKNAGLPSKQQLEELHELREQVVSLSDSLLEKEAVSRRQREELQDLYSCQAQRSALEARLKEVQAGLTASEADKAALLDFIQEMQDREARLKVDHEAAVQSVQDAGRRTQAAESQCHDAQELLADQRKLAAAAQKQAAELEAALKASRAAGDALSHEHNQLQTHHVALRKQHVIMMEEVQRMQANIQGVMQTTDSHPHYHHQLHEAASPPPGATALRSTSPAPRDAHSSADSTVMSTQLVSQLAYVSCQLHQLVAQHRQLQQAWDQSSNLQQQVNHLTEQMLEVEARQAHSTGRAAQFDEQLRGMQAQWARLGELVNDVCACQGLKTLQYVSGREHEFVTGVERQLHQVLKLISKSERQCESVTGECNDALAKLAAAQEDRERLIEQAHDAHEQLGKSVAQKDAVRKECDTARAQVAGLQQEVDRLKRHLASTQEELKHTRHEVARMMPAEEATSLLSRSSELQTHLEAAQEHMHRMQAQHESELQAALHAKADLGDEVEVLRAQLATLQRDRDQLVLRAQAVNEALVEQEQELLRMKALARGATPLTDPLARCSTKPCPPWSSAFDLGRLVTGSSQHVSQAGEPHISPALQVPGWSAAAPLSRPARHNTPSKPAQHASSSFHAAGRSASPPARAPPGAQHAQHRWIPDVSDRSSSSESSDGEGVRDQQRGSRRGRRGARDVGPEGGGSIAAAAWRQSELHARSPGRDRENRSPGATRSQAQSHWGLSAAAGKTPRKAGSSNNLSQLIEKVGSLSRQALAESQSWGTPAQKQAAQADRGSRVVAGGLLPLQGRAAGGKGAGAKVTDKLTALTASYNHMRRSLA